MRDPNRIQTFCGQLAALWRNVPDWRFGQFISNVLGAYVSEKKRDIFFPEDDEIMAFMKQYFKSDHSSPYTIKPMESAKGLVKFHDLTEQDPHKTEDHFGILFESGWVLCLCCGGYIEPGKYEIVKDYDGFEYLDETLIQCFE